MFKFLGKAFTLLVLSIFFISSAQARDYKEGQDYEIRATNKTVEPAIREFFSFFCSHCFAMEKPFSQMAEFFKGKANFIVNPVGLIGGDVGVESQKAYAVAINLEIENELKEELIDRFGDIPKPAVILMSIALLKSKCHGNYITEIKGNRKEIKIRLYHRAMINPAGIPDIVKKKGIRMKFTTGESPYFTYYFEQAETKNTEEYIRTIDKIVDEIGTLKISEESK